MEKNRISLLQLVILLFLSRQFTSLTYFPGIGKPVSGTAMLYSYLISAGVLLLLFLPLVIMANRAPERSIVMNLQGELGGFGVFGSFLYYGYVVFLGAHTLAHFQFFMTNAVFPQASVWIIILPMLAVASYAAYIGIEGIARSGFLIFIGFLLAFALIIFSSIPNVQLQNLYPIEKNVWTELTKGSYGILSRTTEPILFALLLPYLGGKAGKASVGFSLLFTVIQEISTFFILTVLGNFSYSQTFPFYSLASMSQISVFQRMDALYMGIWVFVGFIKLSLLLMVGKDILNAVFLQQGKPLPTQLGLWITAGLMLGLAIPACFKIELLTISYRFLFNGVVVLLLILFFPLILLIKTAFAKRKRKEGAK